MKRLRPEQITLKLLTTIIPSAALLLTMFYQLVNSSDNFWKAEEPLKIPAQESPWSCGPTSIRILFSLYKIHLTENDILHYRTKSSISLEALRLFLEQLLGEPMVRSFDFVREAKKTGSNLKDLKIQLGKPLLRARPAIVRFWRPQWGPSGHVVVAWIPPSFAPDSNKVQVYDPILGKYNLSYDKFTDRWDGRAITLNIPSTKREQQIIEKLRHRQTPTTIMQVPAPPVPLLPGFQLSSHYTTTKKNSHSLNIAVGRFSPHLDVKVSGTWGSNIGIPFKGAGISLLLRGHSSARRPLVFAEGNISSTHYTNKSELTSAVNAGITTAITRKTMNTIIFLWNNNNKKLSADVSFSFSPSSQISIGTGLNLPGERMKSIVGSLMYSPWSLPLQTGLTVRFYHDGTPEFVVSTTWFFFKHPPIK